MGLGGECKVLEHSEDTLNAYKEQHGIVSNHTRNTQRNGRNQHTSTRRSCYELVNLSLSYSSNLCINHQV